MSRCSKASEQLGVFAENPGETADGVFPENRAVTGEREPCGARTRDGGRCLELVEVGRRCRLHGGESTGPCTAEGRRRISEAMRARYIKAALADGWVLPSDALRARVNVLKAALNGSHNATAQALGLTWHGVRRVLSGLPMRPEEASRLSILHRLWVATALGHCR